MDDTDDDNNDLMMTFHNDDDYGFNYGSLLKRDFGGE